MVLSFKLIYEELMKSLSQGEMKNQLINNKDFLNLKESAKKKVDIIKMGVQTQIEGSNFRRSLERYHDY